MTAAAQTTSGSKALEVRHDIPSPTLVVADDLVEECHKLAAQADAFDEVTADNLTDAANVTKGIARQLRAVESARKEAKAPALDFNKQIDAIAKKAKAPLDAAKSALGRKVATYQADVERERREAQRLANEQLREAAEAEAKERAEMAEVFGATEGPQLAPVVVEKPVVVPEKITGTGVSVRKVPRLVILDETQIPASIGHRKLWVLDERAVLEILKAGVDVPGATLEYEEIVAVRG